MVVNLNASYNSRTYLKRYTKDGLIFIPMHYPIRLRRKVKSKERFHRTTLYATFTSEFLLLQDNCTRWEINQTIKGQVRNRQFFLNYHISG